MERFCLKIKDKKKINISIKNLFLSKEIQKKTRIGTKGTSFL